MLFRSLAAALTLIGTVVSPSVARPASAEEGAPQGPRVERGCRVTEAGYTCFYGPYEVGPGGHEVLRIVPAPNAEGYITDARATLVDRDNDELSRHMVHLHHAVWANPVADDLTCDWMPDRFFGSGKERTPMHLPDGYGYYWANEASSAWPYSGKKGWGLTAHLDGMHGMTHDGVFIRLRMGFTRSSDATLTPIRPFWIDVNGSCTTNPVFDVAKGSGTDGRFKKSATLDMPVSGEFIGMAGHLHDGGLRLRLANQTTHERVFTSRALYQDRDYPWFLTGMTSFYEAPGRAVDAGDDLRLTAVYDSTHNWDDVMGIMLGALVEQ